MTKMGQNCPVPACDSCGGPSVFIDRVTGMHLCAEHLVSGIEARVSSTIQCRRMVSDGDFIAVGLSGGKDSSVLLTLLATIVPRNWDVNIVAITVDEGIAGYREDTIQSARNLTSALGIRHCIVSFQDMFGDTLDHILTSNPVRACTACGILRKKALADKAKSLGATCIATGHNLDDAAQSVLMNYLRGDFDRLTRDSSATNRHGFIPRIKPLQEVSEKEITLYSIIRGITGTLPECPYATTALRAEVRTMQAALEYHYPGSSMHLIRGQEELSALAKIALEGVDTRICTMCGDPCSGQLCQACSLIKRIGKNQGDYHR